MNKSIECVLTISRIYFMEQFVFTKMHSMTWCWTGQPKPAPQLTLDSSKSKFIQNYGYIKVLISQSNFLVLENLL